MIAFSSVYQENLAVFTQTQSLVMCCDLDDVLPTGNIDLRGEAVGGTDRSVGLEPNAVISTGSDLALLYFGSVILFCVDADAQGKYCAKRQNQCDQFLHFYEPLL